MRWLVLLLLSCGCTCPARQSVEVEVKTLAAELRVSYAVDTLGEGGE